MALPRDVALYQNSPNPFVRSTAIRYTLPMGHHVTLKIFDMLGREVTTLVDEEQGAGVKTVEFNTGNLPSGIYSYRSTAGLNVSVKKMAVLR